MADMITWVKPSGIEVKTNSAPATIEKAKSLGWKRGKAKPKPKKED